MSGGILLGLLCSMGGNMFLELSAGMFVVGLGWFLTAHLFYVMAYNFGDTACGGVAVAAVFGIWGGVVCAWQ